MQQLIKDKGSAVAMFSGKRFGLLKQRMVGRGESEPMELKALKKEVFQLKGELVKTKKGKDR